MSQFNAVLSSTWFCCDKNAESSENPPNLAIKYESYIISNLLLVHFVPRFENWLYILSLLMSDDITVTDDNVRDTFRPSIKNH